MAVVKSLGGDLAIFEADHERTFFARTRNARIHVVDVDFCFEKSAQDMFHVAFSVDFDDKNLGFGVGKFVFEEKSAGAIGIVDEEPDNRAVGRIENGQREDVNIVGIEETDQIREATDLILSEYGKLHDRFAPVSFFCADLH